MSKTKDGKGVDEKGSVVVALYGSIYSHRSISLTAAFTMFITIQPPPFHLPGVGISE